MFTVIIPCYNYGRYVANAINSALNQTVPVEIVVCNDASTDDTSEVLRKFEDKIKVVTHTTNRGLPASRNDAIREATGEFIIPLDADDELLPDYCQTMLPGFKSGIGIVRGTCILFGPEVNEETIWNLQDCSLKTMLRYNKIFVSSSFPKIIWEELDGYDENMRQGYEDWEFWIRILSEGYGVSTILKPVFRYRIHSGSKGRVRPPEVSLRSLGYMVRKHYDLYKKVRPDLLEDLTIQQVIKEIEDETRGNEDMVKADNVQ